MGRLAPPPPDIKDDFPYPDIIVTFLGGPMDGIELEPDTDDPMNMTYPEWIQPHDTPHRYYLMLPNELPAWLVNAPLVDAFSQVYVWGPYYWTEMGYA